MIPRFKPSLGLPEIAAVLRKNQGAVQQFEKDFAQKFKAVDAVAFPYGRSAQWAFFKAMGIEKSEIIMPAYTCSVVAYAVTLSGNQPVFIDIKKNNYNMDLEIAEAALSRNTRAIVATHTFGYPQDLTHLKAIVKKGEKKYGKKIWLIQDCCHAFGAKWKGQMIGTSGDVAIYALNISKIITSIFGGMLTFQNKALANKVRLWRDSQYNQATWIKELYRRLYIISACAAFNDKMYSLTNFFEKNTFFLNRITKSYHLDKKIAFPPDFLEKMSDVEAAIGIKQLDRYEKIILKRKKTALFYDKYIKRPPDWNFPMLLNGATYSHYVIQVPNRDCIVKKYASKGLDVGTLINYSIPSLPEYQHMRNVYCPNAEEISRKTINLPLLANEIKVLKILNN